MTEHDAHVAEWRWITIESGAYGHTVDPDFGVVANPHAPHRPGGAAVVTYQREGERLTTFAAAVTVTDRGAVLTLADGETLEIAAADLVCVDAVVGRWHRDPQIPRS